MNRAGQTMSIHNDNEIVTNSGYGSGDETTSLLVPGPSVTVIVPNERTNKPVLQRQDCTTYLRPQLSGGAGSEESGGSVRIEESVVRSVPDIELQCRTDEKPQILQTNTNVVCRHKGFNNTFNQLPHNCPYRCRICERRSSTAPMSSLQLARSVSRESVKSALHLCGCSSLHTMSTCQQTSLLLPNANRIIRQSSQPEASACVNHCPHHHHVPSASLRQLRELGDGIACIAADSLRINGGMRPFRQGVLLCPQTLSQARRARLRRAFTEATAGDTIRTVRNKIIIRTVPTS